MMRKGLVLTVVLASLALIVWSGLANCHARISAPSAPRPVLIYHPDATVRSVPAESDAVDSPLLNQPAPEFRLRDLNGREVTMEDYRGKAVLINFWATWCAPCRVEMPWFVALRQHYAAQGFEVLGIDHDYPEDLAKVPAFVRKMQLSYPVLYGNAKTYTSYHCCDYLPMSYYVDRRGHIRVATVGLGERDQVEADIRKVLADAH